MTDQKIAGIGSTAIHNNTAWLAHIIVHPDYRNQSIGKLITRTLIEISNAQLCNTIYLLAIPAGEPVYKKAGVETETGYVCFKGIKTAAGLTHSEPIVAFNNDFKKQISAIDRQVSGEDRMIRLEQHLSHSFVYVKANTVEGFYLPTLGDGLIVATTLTAGQDLINLRLTSKDVAAFPTDNIMAAAYMRRHNFRRCGEKKDAARQTKRLAACKPL